MRVHACRMCDESILGDARFCHSCGAPLNAVVVDVDSVGVGSEQGEDQSASPLRWLAVPLALVLGVGLLGAVVFGGERTPDSAGTEASEAPEFGFSPTPPDEPEPTATVRPTPTPRVPAAVVDPGSLPSLRASHVVVGARRNLQFLDLETGIWTRADIPSDLYEMHSLPDGVVFTQPSGSIAYASTSGSEIAEVPTQGHSSLLGTLDGLVVLGAHDPGPTGERVEGRTIDGNVVWSAALPSGARPHGLTRSGLVIMQANEQVALFDARAEAFTTVATGSVVGSIGEVVLVESCDAELRCGTDQVHAITGERHRVTEDAGWFQTTGEYSLRFHSALTRDILPFNLVDGVVTAGDVGGPEGSHSATDSTGVTVDISGDELRFSEGDRTLAAVPSPLNGCCNDSIVALIVGDPSAS